MSSSFCLDDSSTAHSAPLLWPQFSWYRTMGWDVYQAHVPLLGRQQRRRQKARRGRLVFDERELFCYTYLHTETELRVGKNCTDTRDMLCGLQLRKGTQEDVRTWQRGGFCCGRFCHDAPEHIEALLFSSGPASTDWSLKKSKTRRSRQI
jgi:hypothetical protein